MTNITPLDGLVVLLRQRLAERTGKTRAGSRARTGEGAGASAPKLVQALAEIEGVDDRRLRRALIQDILGNHFGKAMVNDARFQQVIDKVTSTLEADADASSAFSRVISDLRGAAR